MADPHAANQLLPLLYDELRRLAAQQMAREEARPHLATYRVGSRSLPAFGRRHRIAPLQNPEPVFRRSRPLPCVISSFDNARRKARDKRGGDWARVPLLDHADPHQHEAEQLLALDEALLRLAATDTPGRRVLVQLHTFGGLSVEEAGHQQIGLSRAAAYRQWAWARAWLRCEVGENSEKS